MNMKKSERRAKIFELYSEGKSIDEICLILGYHRADYVRSVLREGGIPLVDKPNGIDVLKVLALRKAGWHMADILEELGNEFTAEQVIQAVEDYDEWNRLH